MSGTKEIKDRIASVRDTQKITNAMYLIASTKLRKARAELDRTRPYFDALRSEIKRIFRTVEGVESRYFTPVTITRSAEPMRISLSRRIRVWPVCITRTCCARRSGF